MDIQATGANGELASGVDGHGSAIGKKKGVDRISLADRLGRLRHMELGCRWQVSNDIAAPIISGTQQRNFHQARAGVADAHRLICSATGKVGTAATTEVAVVFSNGKYRAADTSRASSAVSTPTAATRSRLPPAAKASVVIGISACPFASASSSTTIGKTGTARGLVLFSINI